MTLKRIQTNDRIISQVQDNVDTALIPLQNSPLTGGVLLSAVSLVAANDNIVSHNLGHIPLFAIAGIPNVSTNIWQIAATTQTITLKCGTDCIVSVWLN